MEQLRGFFREKIEGFQKKQERRRKNREDKKWAENPPLHILLQQGYMECLKTMPIEEHSILLESEYGEKISYTIKAIAKVLLEQSEYEAYTVYVVCTKKKLEQKNYLEQNGLINVKAVIYDSEEYYQILATAKILINDGNFVPHFIKREQQVYVKLWDAIPMKSGGRYANSGYGSIGNVQKNLLCADYLLCQNKFVMDYLVDSYMLSNIGKTKVMLTGNVQNEELFCQNLAEEIRKLYHLEEKEVFLYCPILEEYKDMQERKVAEEKLLETLCMIDERLTEEQVMLVIIPRKARNIVEVSQLRHVIQAPDNYTICQLLSVVDVLVSDGSTCIFNFAVTRKKIILFDYLQNNIFEKRYQFHSNLPFTKVWDVNELILELNREKQYDDTKFFEIYCQANKMDMAKLLCRKILLNEDISEIEMYSLPDNGKENILIYPGELLQNGITASINSLLQHLDTKKNNYILFYRMDTENIKEKERYLKNLPKEIAYYGYKHVRGVSGTDVQIYNNWVYEEHYSYKKAKEMLYRRIDYERNRLLSFCRIDAVIHYDGYGMNMMTLFETMPCKRIIYVHNNMVNELKKKAGMHKEILSHAYQSFDYVALVSEEQRPTTQVVARYIKDNTLPKKGNIVLAKNVINCERILRLAKEKFTLDENTQMSVSVEKLEQLLASNTKKFITIGRFSAEKGHLRLLDAFEEIHREYPDTCLIILGGYGPLYEKTIQKAQSLTAKDNVAVIQYLSNPYALLKQCDYFALSSFYEGLPVVLTEADLLGLPCFSTDIPGSSAFLKQYGGLLVENSTKGVIDGMKACLEERVPKKLTLDYIKYNEEAIEQFEQMLPR